MRYCVLCRKKGGNGSGVFFTIPQDPKRREKWSQVCGKEFTAGSRICIDHFAKADIITAGSRRLLMPSAVPIVEEQKKTMENSVMPIDYLGSSCPMEFDPPERPPHGLRFFSMKELSSTAASRCPEQNHKEKESQTDEHLNGRGNVENDDTDWLNSSDVNMSFAEHARTSAEALREVDDVLNENVLCEDFLPDSVFEEQNCNDSIEEGGMLNDLNDSNTDDIGILQEDALEYIAGYIIRKLNLVEYECHQDSYTWVDQVSKGSLKKPTNEFVIKIKQMESIFYKVNGHNISHCRNIRRHLVEESASVDLPENVKQFFFKCRIYFRIRSLNKRLKAQKKSQRKLACKKLLKIKL